MIPDSGLRWNLGTEPRHPGTSEPRNLLGILLYFLDLFPNQPFGRVDHDPANQLIVVPAGLFGNLLSGLAGTIGGAVGGMFGDEETGKAIGEAASGLISMVPFHTVPPAMVAG